MSRITPSLSALRNRIARLDPVPSARTQGLFPLGARTVDQRLGGGLARGTLHEVFAAAPEDAASAGAFALMLALRCGDGAKPILWIRDDRVVRRCGHIHGPGLAEMGADPDRFILISAPDELATLRAGADSVKCGGVGAVVIEPYGKAKALDLTATRRLALAAGVSGVLTLLLRVDAEPVASAAQTRWRVAAAQSQELAANAPGMTALDISLLRHRSGIAGFEARLEWNRDQQICTDKIQSEARQAVSGSLHAVPVFGEDQAKAA